MKKVKSVFLAVLVFVFATTAVSAGPVADFFFLLGLDIGIGITTDALLNKTEYWNLDDIDFDFDEDEMSYFFSYEKSKLFYKKGKKAEKNKRYVHALSYYYDAYEYDSDNEKAARAYLRLSKKIIYEKIKSDRLLESLKNYYNEYPYFGLEFSNIEKKGTHYSAKYKIYVTKKNKEIIETVLTGLDGKDSGGINTEDVTVKISGVFESTMTDKTLGDFEIEGSQKKTGEVALDVQMAEYGTNFEMECGYYKIVVNSFMMKSGGGDYRSLRVDGFEVRK